MDIHVKLHNTEAYKKSVTNMATKLYSNLPGFVKEIDYYMAFHKELKLFLFWRFADRAASQYIYLSN